VSDSYGKRTRRTARLDLRKIAVDPFSSSLNAQYSMSAYVVIDVPTVGYTLADEVTNTAGLLTWLTASTNAKLTQLMGGET
jgi:ethanolamine transporter EutH